MITTGTSELSEVILYVQNMNRQVSFYRDVLGFAVKQPLGVKDFRDFYSVELNTGSCTLILHAGRKGYPAEDSPRLIFRVNNIYGTRYDLIEQDVAMDEIHSPAPGVQQCNGKDPEGNLFAIEARKDIADTPLKPSTPDLAPGDTASIAAHSLRGRCIMLFRHNKVLIAAEILFITALVELLSFVGVVPLISILLLVMALLWLHGTNWSTLGFNPPTSIRRTIILGLSFGVLFSILQMFAVGPIVSHFFPPPPLPNPGTPPHQNILMLIYNLISTWTSAGFAEEMIFRGYLLNRLADLFGHRFWGWVIALFIQAAIFGSAHAYEHLDGMVTVGIYGVMIGLLYFGSKRNLWACAIAHAITDTIAFTLNFVGI
ncbi:MAG TPA: CPBP family glutamic-type intramembrane protease [Ktedonobacteraceae bacterium]|nr:CPBP family glutamic-type intramembrane protease [Ktedonobacteraceae bacterium]